MIYMYTILMTFICHSDTVSILWTGITGGAVPKPGPGGGVCVLCDPGPDRQCPDQSNRVHLRHLHPGE